jgi:YidC/Oxa1 family membrane protein insertase
VCACAAAARRCAQGPVKDYGSGLAWLTENWVDGHPSLGWHDTVCYLSLPLILVLSQSVSMRIMTPPADPDNPQAQSTQQIMRFLPLMIGWFSLSAPAGLGLYWFFNNVLTTAQSVLIKTLIKAGVGAEEKEPQL